MRKRTRAICGIAICGYTICGDISYYLPTVSSSDIKGVAQITTPDGWFTYFFPLVSGEIILNQPFTDDSAIITIVHNGQLLIDSDVSIHLGKGLKKVVFMGKIKSETQKAIIGKGNIISELECISRFDELAHRYLKEGDQQKYHGTLSEVIQQFISLTGMDIINKSSNDVDIVDLSFKYWELSLLDCLYRILGDKCMLYLNGNTLVIEDKSDEIKYTIDKNSKITNISVETSQEDSYRRCHVRGVKIGEDSAGNDIYIIGEAVDEMVTSNKEIFIEDDTVLTEWDARQRAEQELKTRNELTDAIEITLADLVYPVFGKVRVNLPGINKILELKSLRYTLDENGLYTTLYLGRSYKSLSTIFRSLK